MARQQALFQVAARQQPALAFLLRVMVAVAVVLLASALAALAVGIGTRMWLLAPLALAAAPALVLLVQPVRYMVLADRLQVVLGCGLLVELPYAHIGGVELREGRVAVLSTQPVAEWLYLRPGDPETFYTHLVHTLGAWREAQAGPAAGGQDAPL